MKVAFTWFPDGGGERNVWTEMSIVPRVGDGVHLGSDQPIRDVVRVLWVGVHNDWHAEVTLR